MSSMESIFEAQDKLRSELNLHKIKAVPNPNYKHNGIRSYVRSMHRFGFQPTQPGPYFHQKTIHQRGLANSEVAQGGRLHIQSELVKRSHDPDATGGHHKVTAEDIQMDSQYICEVYVGTPPQMVKLDFDTGSSDLWVMSTHTRVDKSNSQAQAGKDVVSEDQLSEDQLSQGHSSQDQSSQITGHNLFDPSRSHTWKLSPHSTWNIGYGDGSAALGFVGTDVVCVGGLQVRDQSIEIASKVSLSFAQGAEDGLLGLGWTSNNTIKTHGKKNPQPTLVTNMINQKEIPQHAQLFTSAFYSSRDKAAESFYTFGYIDQDLVKASGKSIVYADVDTTNGFWQFASTSASVNGKTVTQPNNTAIADTGTTLALVSDAVCKALYGVIKGAFYSEQQQGWLIPTSVTVADLPDFGVAVGTTEFIIQKEDLLFALADKDHWYGGVQSRGDNPFDILGDTFLKSIYAIWDQGNRRFGAVPKIERQQNIVPAPFNPNGH